MSNQRSVLTEFRALDQKRQVEGLSAEEAARYVQLRDLVGAEAAPPPRSGFDVNAAAARLRESLLPAGLRSRPLEPEAAPAAPPPAPAPPPEVTALEQAWAEAPFAPLTPEADPLFDPGSLAAEARPQAWNPEAPGYDPDAPYDEAAWIAAGYDPNATYDWSAAGYGPDGQPLAEGAPAAEAAWDGTGSELPAEPLAEPALEPTWDAPPAELEPAAEAAPAEEPAWSTAPEADPEPPPVDQGLVLEPEPAAPAAEEELPFDPNAPFDHAKWFGRAGGAVAPAPEPAAVEPAPEPEITFDLAPEAAPAAEVPVAFGEYDESAVAPPGELLAAEPLPGESASAEAEASPGWFDGAGPASHEPAPVGAPLGEYDEAGSAAAGDALAAMLPFDPAAASAIEQGGIPEGYEPGGPALDPASLPALEPGGYDDPSDFPADASSGGPEGGLLPGGAPLELGAGPADWQPEAALEQGFELASDGSFGHAGPPPVRTTPAWGTAAVPAEGWESAPALDLAGPFEAPTLTPSQPVEAWAPEAAAGAPPAEELPTIDGAELLEELPPEAASPLEPLEPAAESAGSPLDGAFDQAAEVEAAAYAPPDLLADASSLEVEPFGAPAEGFDPPTPLEPEAPYAAIAPAEAAPEQGFLEPVPLEPEPVPAWAQPAPEPVPADPTGLQAAGQAWEPEPAISYEAPLEGGGSGVPPEIAAAYADAGAAGDTFELPPAVADGLFGAPPEPEPMEAEPLPPPPPTVAIQGSHRVVLHTVDGQVKRGLLVDALLDAEELPLQGPGAGEAIPTSTVKAIFFMLAPGEKAPAADGRKVRVTFRDGRQVAGFSPDYQEGTVGFFMIPADTRTNTGRIWVYQAAVKQVAVS